MWKRCMGPVTDPGHLADRWFDDPEEEADIDAVMREIKGGTG